MGKLIDGGDWFKLKAPVNDMFEDSDFRDHVLETFSDLEERCEQRLKFTSVSSKVKRNGDHCSVTACAEVLIGM